MKKCLITASVASMLEQFNMPNIEVLQEMGYQVSVGANFINGNTISSKRLESFQQELTAMGVKHYHLPFARNPFHPANIKAFIKLEKIIKRGGFQLIHCQSPVGGVITRLAGGAAVKRNSKMVYTAHGFHFYRGAALLNWLLFYPLEKLLAHRTHRLITMNQEDFSRAAKWRYAKGGSPCFIHGCGVDLKRYSPPEEEEKMKIRQEEGFSSEDRIILYTAELSERKQQHLVIEAMPFVRKKIENAKLILAGKGPLEEKYKELAKKLCPGGEIIFAGYRKDVDRLAKAADMAVSVARQEGLPLNIVEAMAAGLPVAVTNCRGNRDLVDNGVNGLVISQASPEKVASAITAILGSAKKGRQLGRQGAEKAKAYSFDRVKDELRELYGFL